MICYVCSKPDTILEQEETSHLGLRSICHNCIGLRDVIRMRFKKPIILYRNGDYLVNMVRTLSFKIKEEISLSNLDRNILFLFEKKLWQGKSYYNHNSNAIYCSKVVKQKKSM